VSRFVGLVFVADSPVHRLPAPDLTREAACCCSSSTVRVRGCMSQRNHRPVIYHQNVNASQPAGTAFRPDSSILTQFAVDSLRKVSVARNLRLDPRFHRTLRRRRANLNCKTIPGYAGYAKQIRSKCAANGGHRQSTHQTCKPLSGQPRQPSRASENSLR
jgi:hypothetical protein